MKYILFVMLLISGSVMAENEAVMLGMWSHHYSSADDCGADPCNETHDLVAIEGDNYILGTYHNSLRERTWLAGIQSDDLCDTKRWKTFCFDFIMGVATGYEEQTGQPVSLFLAPRFTVKLYDNVSFQILGAPGFLLAGGFKYTF